MNQSLRFRCVLKSLVLSCLLPCGILATVAPLAAESWTREPLEPVSGAGPLTPSETQAAGGWIQPPGLPPVPKESVAAAIPPLEGLAKAARAVDGAGSAGVGRLVGYLAQLYGALGDFDRAQARFDEAVRILVNYPDKSEDLAWLYNNMGMVHFQCGEVSEANLLFQRSLDLLDTDQHPSERVVALQNLASVSTSLANWDLADRSFEEALNLLETLQQQQTEKYRTIQQNLAVLRLVMGDFERARVICESLLESRPRLNPRLRLALLNNLGEALRGLELYEGAERALEEALQLVGKDSPMEAKVLSNLAVVSIKRGKLGQASERLERSLDILEASPDTTPDDLVAPLANLATVAISHQDLNQAQALLERAQRLWSRNGSPVHPFNAGVLKGLAVVAWQRGETNAAKDLAVEALDLEQRSLEQVLRFGTEAERLAYRRQGFLYDLLATLEEPRLLAEAVLSVKGAVTESLLQERALARLSRVPEHKRRFEHIRSLKRQIMASLVESSTGGTDRARREELIRELKQEESALARSLGRLSASRTPTVDLDRLQMRLEQDEAFIDIIRFERVGDGARLLSHYGAVLIPQQGEPRWVPLGSAAEIEAAVDQLAACLGKQGRGSDPLDCGGSSGFRSFLGELHRRLWHPLARALPPDTRTLFLSPDGALHFVPWAALPNEEGRFVAEDLDLFQVTSGRDLVRDVARATPKTVLAVGRNDDLLTLPEREVQDLAGVACRHGWAPRILTGDQASERALFEEPSPGILHFSGHGHFLRNSALKGLSEAVRRLPMLRSYVALANAPESLEAWREGRPPAAENDGLLTAEEAAGLDLGKTWLTTLSACETGLGEAARGESVLGLRHGFRLAGSRHLLFSLWKIGDEDAHRFMELFYPRLFETKDVEEAFAEVQRAELLRIRDEDSLAEAVLAAGGFVLTR
ncbi:MAG: CHAT domain-containing tetratricopeptide repeat protein [Acidobacteriota bacterium]|nr:CHAT domain-containing tetratricopeptide repeat protein [Acidobacteriota bacterium]